MLPVPKLSQGHPTVGNYLESRGTSLRVPSSSPTAAAEFGGRRRERRRQRGRADVPKSPCPATQQGEGQRLNIAPTPAVCSAPGQFFQLPGWIRAENPQPRPGQGAGVS